NSRSTIRPCASLRPRPYQAVGQRGAAQRASTTLASQALRGPDAAAWPPPPSRNDGSQLAFSQAATSSRSWASETWARSAVSGMSASELLDIAFAVDGGRPEQLGVGSGAAQVEVRRMGPGEGDAAVHLDAGGGGLGEGVGAGERRQADRRRRVGRALGQP